MPKQIIVAQGFPLFMVNLGADDNEQCRVVPCVYAVTGWVRHSDHEGSGAEPVAVPLGPTPPASVYPWSRRYFHNFDSANAYIAQEQAAPEHPAGH